MEKLPPTEMYGLIIQLQGEAVSVPSNMAEGSARGHTREYIQFLYHTRGSLAEVVTQLELSKRLGYIRDTDLESLRVLACDYPG